MGGHGERLTQCREVLLTTAKAIPVQVDGEPCKLSASRIRIALRNQATMVQKAKRRSTAPLHSDQQPVPEQLRIQVSRVSMHDYEALHYDKEQLKEACEWLQGWGREGRAAAGLPGTCSHAAGTCSQLLEGLSVL